MDDIYFNCVLNRKIIIEPKYLNKNIDQCIESYLKKKIEGFCIHEGFVKPDTIKILKKSTGMLIGSRFTGDITYDIAYTAQICNPVIGNIIDCNIKFINKLGILCTAGPINIIISRQFHTNDDELNHFKTGDLIKVEVIAKKFSLNDREIKIIAKLWNNNDKSDNKNNNIKKELISSDVTPINIDNEFLDNENLEIINNDSDDNEEYSVDDMDEELESEYDEEEDTKLQLPEDENFDIADIEMDDEEDDFDNESVIDED